MAGLVPAIHVFCGTPDHEFVMAGPVPGIHVFCGVRKQDVDAREVARILRPGGRFSSTKAAGDPDRVKRTELDAFAALAGLEKGESWSGLLVKTFNYNKPRSLAKARGSDFPQNRKMARRGR